MDDLARLVAVEEIKKLKARYFRGVDGKDPALLETVFTEDVVLDARGSTTDPDSGANAVPEGTAEPLRGRGRVIEMVQKVLAGATTVHQGQMPEIDITSDTTATGIWSFFDLLRFPPGAPVSELAGYGHYHETYVRIDRAWRIKTIRITRLRVDATVAES